MAMWVIAGIILTIVVVSQVRQNIKSKQSQRALASNEATAMLKGTKGLYITDVDGHDLFVPEIALIPGTHRITFQVTESGGLVNLPAADYEIHAGLTWVHWSGTSKKDVQVWLQRDDERSAAS